MLRLPLRACMPHPSVIHVRKCGVSDEDGGGACLVRIAATPSTPPECSSLYTVHVGVSSVECGCMKLSTYATPYWYTLLRLWSQASQVGQPRLRECGSTRIGFQNPVGDPLLLLQLLLTEWRRMRGEPPRYQVIFWKIKRRASQLGALT